MNRYENIPSPEWQKLYVALRSEEREVRESAVRNITAAHVFSFTPNEFVETEGVEPYNLPDGSLAWIDTRQVDPTTYLNWPEGWKQPLERPTSTAVNQTAIRGNDNWDIPIDAFCNIPIVALIDKRN